MTNDDMIRQLLTAGFQVEVRPLGVGFQATVRRSIDMLMVVWEDADPCQALYKAMEEALKDVV